MVLRIFTGDNWKLELIFNFISSFSHFSVSLILQLPKNKDCLLEIRYSLFIALSQWVEIRYSLLNI